LERKKIIEHDLQQEKEKNSVYKNLLDERENQLIVRENELLNRQNVFIQTEKILHSKLQTVNQDLIF
jgi:hypothetical protein